MREEEAYREGEASQGEGKRTESSLLLLMSAQAAPRRATGSRQQWAGRAAMCIKVQHCDCNCKYNSSS